MSKVTIVQELMAKELSIYKQRYTKEKILNFQKELDDYKTKIKDAIKNKKDEEFFKKIINNFLEKVFYSNEKYDINTYGNVDSSICSNEKLFVLLEMKTPQNVIEMVKENNINYKALHEIIFYYLLQTRDLSGNKVKIKRDVEIKRLVITDSCQWFIFNANDVEKICKGYLEQQFFKYKKGQLIYNNNNSEFYKELKEYFDSVDITKILRYVYFNVNEYKDKKNIQYLYKILDKGYLLKEGYIEGIKAHALNKNFYQELLYIMGLKENKESKKIIITIDKTIKNSMAAQIYDKLEREKDYSEQERIEKTFEMIIIWINRLLFIKLFEGQLIAFNSDKFCYHILNKEKIKDFEELNNLFFEVLGKKERNNTKFLNLFSEIPYLNSSLFEHDAIETTDFHINALKNEPIMKKRISILNKKEDKFLLLDYIIDFLNSYYFNATITDDETITGGEIINAAVLGLIFEKLNGYKDGSYYTPSAVTSYMCRETIEATCIDKINNAMNWNCSDLFEIKKNMDGSLSQIKQLNEIINSIKICDPAVGSGHFLVSALNHIIALKSELGILLIHGRNELLTQYEIQVHDDILCISNGQGENFKYVKEDTYSQKVQETLFNEKRTIIEECLFGVDINSKAVAICRLRLWIELLKNAYYSHGVMETLPNIDINIKCGDSLINKLNFSIGSKLGKQNPNLEKQISKLIGEYKELVKSYKIVADKSKKREIKMKIKFIKDNLRNFYYQTNFIIDKNNEIIYDTGDSVNESIYKNIFEWAIEFPEIIKEDGTFLGFDCIIGNPPYFNVDTYGYQSPYMKYLMNEYSEIWRDKSDILFYFIYRSIKLSNNKVCLITSNAFLFSNKGDKLRNYIIDNRPISKIINFEKHRIFENAFIMCCIFTLEKNKKNALTKALLYKEHVDRLESALDNTDDIFDVKFKKNATFALIQSSIVSINNKIDSKHPKLGELFEISQGMQTAANKVFVFNEKPPFSEDYIRPRLNGERIKRYCISPITEYLLYYEFIERFDDLDEELRSYLEINKPVLEDRATVKNEGRDWWRYSRPLFKEYYEYDKIWSSYRATHNSFAFDDTKKYIGLTDTTVIFGTNEQIDLKYALALLNSKTLEYRYKNGLGKPTGSGVFEYFKNQIGELPIPKIDKQDQSPFIEIVTKIIERKKKDISLSIDDLQDEIDIMVYKLYGLNSKEISVIENI